MAAYPHIEWLDLNNDGTIVECAIVKKDGFNNKYFIALRHLDQIDKERLARILTSRNAPNFELWDLLAQSTLGNGLNALEYFDQYVKVLTPSGTITERQQGVIGAPVAPAPAAPAPAAE